MSYSRRSKLPPLKLTVWSGAGTPTKRVVHRGLKSHVESTGFKVAVYSMNDNYHVFSKIHKNFKKYVS